MSTRWTGRIERIAGLVMVALGLLCTLSSCMPAGVYAAATVSTAQVVETPVSLALQDAARRLGWPLDVRERLDLPGQAYGITDDSTLATGARWAAISTMGSADDATLLDRLEQEGMAHGLFHGWEAVIAHPGDSLSTESQVATRGIIAWRCGPYVLAVEDGGGTGREGRWPKPLMQRPANAWTPWAAPSWSWPRPTRSAARHRFPNCAIWARP